MNNIKQRELERLQLIARYVCEGCRKELRDNQLVFRQTDPNDGFEYSYCTSVCVNKDLRIDRGILREGGLFEPEEFTRDLGIAHQKELNKMAKLLVKNMSDDKYAESEEFRNLIAVMHIYAGIIEKSERATLTAYLTKDDTIEIARGCFRGSIDEFLAAVERTHGDNEYGREYRALMEYLKVRVRK